MKVVKSKYVKLIVVFVRHIRHTDAAYSMESGHEFWPFHKRSLNKDMRRSSLFKSGLMLSWHIKLWCFYGFTFNSSSQTNSFISPRKESSQMLRCVFNLFFQWKWIAILSSLIFMAFCCSEQRSSIDIPLMEQRERDSRSLSHVSHLFPTGKANSLLR